MPKPTLDIVLPCYNPQEGWANSVLKSFEIIQRELNDTAIQLILVNDGSSNKIEDDLSFLRGNIPALIVESYSINKGKGFAVRKGVKRAQSDFVLYTDIDFPYEESGLVAIYNALWKDQCDVALGIRDENYYENVPIARRIISRLLKSVIRHTLRTPTSDTQAGLKGFNKKGREIFLKTSINRYLFDLEFIWLSAKQKDVRIGCIPVKIKDGILFRKMHFSILFMEGVNFLKIFLKPS